MMNQNVLPQNQTLSQKESEKTSQQNVSKFLVPILYLLAVVLIGISTQFSYWGLVLEAPQYPDGLSMRVFVNSITGDEDPSRDEVYEIDGLNHYIGMKSLLEAAKIERQLAVPAIIIMLVLLVVAAIWNKRYTWLLTLPAIGFPFVFLADIAFWMAYYGNTLDPYAPLSSSIQPFTPPIIGEGVIAQFKTVASVHFGWYLAVFAGFLIIVGLALRYQQFLKQRAS